LDAHVKQKTAVKWVGVLWRNKEYRSIRLSENQLPKRYFDQEQAEGEHDQGLLEGRASFAHQRCALRVL
jgi:hypothetical protein